MTTPQDMQAKMAAIGLRYLQRTSSELTELRRMTAELASGNYAMLKELEILSHRIRGSGAVFGFVDMSDAAGAIEALCVSASKARAIDVAPLAPQFVSLINVLEKELEYAASRASAA